MDVNIREYIPSKDRQRIKSMVIDSEANKLLIDGSLSILEEYQDPAILSFIAENNGFLVGFNVGIVLPNRILLPEGMYVAPSYRGYGIAKMLSEALETASECEVSMAYYNKDLAPYYASQGYISGNNIVVGIKEL